jgi:hypothetical protein
MNLPYRPTHEASYATVSAETFEIDDHGSGVLTLKGPCPRCAAFLEILVSGSVVRTVGGDPVVVICDCECEHPGRPADRRGCGAYWKLIL